VGGGGPALDRLVGIRGCAPLLWLAGMAYDLGTWALRDLARATTSIGVAVPGPYPSHR